MAGWKTVAPVIGHMSVGVVEENVAECCIGGTGNTEAVDGPVLNVQILDD